MAALTHLPGAKTVIAGFHGCWGSRRPSREDAPTIIMAGTWRSGRSVTAWCAGYSNNWSTSASCPIRPAAPASAAATSTIPCWLLSSLNIAARRSRNCSRFGTWFHRQSSKVNDMLSTALSTASLLLTSVWTWANNATHSEAVMLGPVKNRGGRGGFYREQRP